MTRTTTIAMAAALILGLVTAVPGASSASETEPPPPTSADATAGTDGDDVFTLTKTSGWNWSTYNWETGPGVVRTTPGRPDETVVFGYRDITLSGGSGNDTFVVSPTFDSKNLITIDGGPGDDDIDAGTLYKTVLQGGAGANTIVGSAGMDTIISTSDQDTIDGAADYDQIVDTGNEHSGGRTVAPSGRLDSYRVDVGGDVGTVRIRDVGGAVGFVTSGNRPGQGTVPDLHTLTIAKTPTNGPTDLTLVDAELVTGTNMVAYGSAGQDLADVTVPCGTFTRADETGATYVLPTCGNYRQFAVYDFDEVAIHGPWTDGDESFVHRSVRDLLYTFIDAANRTQRAEALKAGTLTRAGLVDQIMALDAYRGYDVDRVFLTFLRRGADPSGKAYWINAIKNGRPLWRFRAQLFGSNEYFTKAGGTNAAYLAKAYTDVLGRAPDPSGQAYWTAKLDAGADRGTVALQFLNAAETRRRLVDDRYRRLLGRLPTLAEQDAGVALLLQPAGEQHLVRTIVLSSDYAAAS